MAHIKVLKNPSPVARHVYFVNASVGRGGTNRRDDVLLVQFFLNRLWPGRFADGAVWVHPNQPPPAIDGIAGTNTIDAILSFQEFYRGSAKSGPSPYNDGRVDVVPPGIGYIGNSHEAYTMIGLNINYGDMYGIEALSRLYTDPAFPAELAKALFT